MTFLPIFSLFRHYSPLTASLNPEMSPNLAYKAKIGPAHQLC